LTLLRPETLPVDSNSRPPLFRFFFLFILQRSTNRLAFSKGKSPTLLLLPGCWLAAAALSSRPLYSPFPFFFFFFFFFFTSKMEDIKNTIAG
jgi:hypothetical protein